MDITIIVEDRMVITDGEVDIFDFDIATNIHAVHWKGFSGEIEYNDGTENLHIDDFSQFLHITNAVPAQRAQRLIENQAEKVAYLSSLPVGDRRAIEYPSINDQLEALYDARMGNTTKLDIVDAAILAVKFKYPKV